MALNNYLNIMLDDLVKLELNKGVSPIELATNIYADDYTEVSIKKQLGVPSCNVIFYDCEFFNDKKIKHEYIYNYNKEFYLQEILHRKNKNFESVWSRSLERTKLLQGIINGLNECGEQDTIDRFLASVPTDLRLLTKELKLQIS